MMFNTSLLTQGYSASGIVMPIWVAKFEILKMLAKAWNKRQLLHWNRLKCQTLDDFISELNRVAEDKNGDSFIHKLISETAQEFGISSEVCWAIFIKWVLANFRGVNHKVLNSVLPHSDIDANIASKITFKFNGQFISPMLLPICS